LSLKRPDIENINKNKGSGYYRVIQTIFQKGVRECCQERKPESVHDVAGNIKCHNKTTATKSNYQI